MEENGNFLHLSGVLTDNPVYGHEVFGEKFYYATLSVPQQGFTLIPVGELLLEGNTTIDVQGRQHPAKAE